MKLEIAQLLIETANEDGNVELLLRPHHSERGSTTAIVFGEFRDLLYIVAEAARTLGAREEADGNPNGVSADELVGQMGRLSFEKMGHQQICY